MTACKQTLFGKLFTLALALFALSSLSFAISTGSCNDGTQYGKCSSGSPGYYCTGSISSPTLQPYPRQCPCTNFPGYVEVDGACVAQTCSDSTPYGRCSTASPGKYCSSGTLIDKASQCTCPSGYHRQGTTEACAQNSGCVYNMVTCSPDKECDKTETSATYNTCVLKTGCQYANPSCQSDSTCVNNQCVRKRGCAYNNPACGSEEVCDNNQCRAKGILDIGTGAPPQTSNSAIAGENNSAISNVSCCCMPTLVGSIVLAGAFVIRRKE